MSCIGSVCLAIPPVIATRSGSQGSRRQGLSRSLPRSLTSFGTLPRALGPQAFGPWRQPGGGQPPGTSGLRAARGVGAGFRLRQGYGGHGATLARGGLGFSFPGYPGFRGLNPVRTRDYRPRPASESHGSRRNVPRTAPPDVAEFHTTARHFRRGGPAVAGSVQVCCLVVWPLPWPSLVRPSYSPLLRSPARTRATRATSGHNMQPPPTLFVVQAGTQPASRHLIRWWRISTADSLNSARVKGNVIRR